MNAEALLDAGAVLPADTAVAKDDTVDTLTARAYRHPGIDGRVVVRLVPAQLGPAEDLSLEFLAFGAAERVDEVGLVRQRALGFPAWALVHDPANGHHALALVKDIERLARIARSRVGPANDGFVALGERLARAVPHFLPTFYEEAGRAFLAADSPSYAAMMFGRARDAERGFGLAIDEERTHAVFLEFALSGALTAKALSAHARDLAGRCAPDVAYERFRRLCVERVRGGLPPYAGLHTDLRRLAKASGLDPLEADRRVLAEMIDAPVILRAPAAFWTAYQSSLSKLAAADPVLRGRLFGMFPANCSDDAWLAILTDSGAVAALTGAGGPDPAGEPGPADGPAGWLTRFAAHRQARSWRETARLPALLELVDRMAPRLIADGEPVTLCGDGDDVDLDLLDACLAHGVPVADPDPDARLTLGHWFDDDVPGRRDLAALAGDARFRQLLGTALERSLGDRHRPEMVARLLDVAGLRVALRGWLHDVATALCRQGLPTLGAEIDRLTLAASPAGFEVNPEAVELAAGHDLGPVLGRTLRAGVLDEFGWPAWEEANARLTAQRADAQKDKGKVAVIHQWPVLLLRSGDQVWAVGPDRIEIEHLAQIPKGQRSWLWRQVLRFVDGALLVCWDRGSDRAGYWTSEPDDVFVVPDDAFRTTDGDSLPLPGGGRTFGAAPLRVGDHGEEHAGPVVSDGTVFWVLTRVDKKRCWREFDPATGDAGPLSRPGFFNAVAFDDAELEVDDCWLRPASGSPAAGPLGQRDGLLGWRVRRHADATLSGEGIDGRSFTLGGELRHGRRGLGGDLAGAVRFPGSTETYGVLHRTQWRSSTVTLCAADGFTIGRYEMAGDAGGAAPKQRFARGTVLVPPLPFWNHLRPRDPRGSAALRALTDERAGRLLAAAAGLGKAATRELVATTLPEITDPALIAGVAGVLRLTAKRASRLRDFAAVLGGRTLFPRAPKEKSGERGAKPAGGTAAEVPAAIAPASDKALYAALGSALPYCYDRGHSAIRLFEAAAAALTGPSTAAVKIKGVDVDWYELLSVLPDAVQRAVAPFTPVEHRVALLALLDAYARSGLAAPGGRLRAVVLTSDQKKVPDDGAVILVGSRRLLVTRSYSPTVHAYDYAPDGRFGPVPGYTIAEEYERRLPADPGRLVDLIRERGAPPFRPELAPDLAASAGISRAEALLLLAGLPDADEAGDLGLSAALRRAARESWSAAGSRGDLLARLLPDDPDDMAALWSEGPRLDRVTAWLRELYGSRTPAADELIEAVQQAGIAHEMPAAQLVHGITDPAACRWLNPGAGEIGPETVAVEIARALPWLAYHLPADHPLRDNLPAVVRAARARLVEADCRIDVGAIDERKVPRLVAALGGTPVIGPEWIQVGPLEVEAQDDWRTVRLRPALLAGPDDPALLALRGHVEDGDDAVYAAIRALLGESLATTVASGRSAVTVGYAQDPARSAPDLVMAVAARFGLGTDAATVYLQLLALPDPTDRNVARWTAWKPARLAAARTELAATDLVVSAKRSRAGRSLFLPGGWLPLRAPHLPVERWKIPILTLDEDGHPALSIVVPIAPAPRIFELAWQRILDGDTPRFDELAATERRR